MKIWKIHLHFHCSLPLVLLEVFHIIKYISKYLYFEYCNVWTNIPHVFIKIVHQNYAEKIIKLQILTFILKSAFLLSLFEDKAAFK